MILALILGISGKLIYDIDPFFHFHKPNTDKYFYPLDNERSQNNGICRHFDYDALITGTSMTENFRTSEMDSIFGTNSIKVPFSGAFYGEINDNIKLALKYNSSLKTVVRCLDFGYFFIPADAMRHDLGEYPTYLYDDNSLNDVCYLFNKSVLFDRIYVMKKATKSDHFEPGITTFDDYSTILLNSSYGVNSVYPEEIHMDSLGEKIHITDEDKNIIDKNIYYNVISLAEEYPDVTFYYFFSPYSIAWWMGLTKSGDIYQQVEAEQYVIEKILKCNNIKLFSFNMRTDITTDFNNYADHLHYGPWINSLILKWMYEGKYQLTPDNYKQYIEDELAFYTSYDYESLNGQEDYEADFFAAALLNQELTGATPMVLSHYSSGSNMFSVTKADKYKYLAFYGKKDSEHGELSVYVYDARTEEMTASLTKGSEELDEEWHQYVLDISQAGESFTIVMNGGNADSTGDSDSSCIFRDITLY